MSLPETFERMTRKSAKRNAVGDTVVPGITLGTVMEVGVEGNRGKVMVALPTQGKNNSYWCRVVSSMAGKKWGSFMMPEIGDEVIVIFADGNINNPFVVGSVFMDNADMPGTYAEKDNNQKVFRTKGGNQVLIVDKADAQKVIVTTPGGLRLELNDENKRMVLSDKEGKNSLTFSTEDGVFTGEAESRAVLKVGAISVTFDGDSGKITVNCDELDVKAGKSSVFKTNTFTVDGSNVSIKASGSARLCSDGAAVIKGSVVKLN